MWLFACAWRAFSLHPGGFFLMKSRAVQTCYVLATPFVFPHDFPMSSPWFPHDFPMISPWFPRDFPGISPWFPHDFPRISPWFPHDFPMISPGFPQDFPRISPWFPHDFPISQQFPNGFPPILRRIQDGVPRTWTRSCSSVRTSEAWPEMAPMFTFITFDNHRES